MNKLFVLFFIHLMFSQDLSFNITNLSIIVESKELGAIEKFSFSKDSLNYSLIRVNSESKNGKDYVQSYKIESSTINQFMKLFNSMIDGYAEYKVKDGTKKYEAIETEVIYQIDDYSFRLKYLYQQYEDLFKVLKKYRKIKDLK